MRIAPSATRLLQLGILFLLVVSAAQVLWWYVDQVIYSETVRERLLDHYGNDVAAAQQALRSGESTARIVELYPHLSVEHGRARVAGHALELIDRERAHRLNRYRWEGGFFLAVLLACMAVLWKALREESLLRRRQQNFIAAVSHEFKSPLASLQLTAETMSLRRLTPEKSSKLVSRMLDDLRRMEEMVSKILDASRLDHGRVRLRPERVCLATAVNNALDEMAARAERAGVQLEANVPERLELRCDPVAARTVLRNLLDNALKASEAAGGARVTVRAERQNDRVRVDVRDDGLGFKPDERARLFEKFYRSGDELRRRSPGSGLGLFIVKRFMQLENGWVRAHSDGPGKGAVFTVFWPVAPEKGA